MLAHTSQVSPLSSGVARCELCCCDGGWCWCWAVARSRAPSSAPSPRACSWFLSSVDNAFHLPLTHLVFPQSSMLGHHLERVSEESRFRPAPRPSSRETVLTPRLRTHSLLQIHGTHCLGNSSNAASRGFHDLRSELGVVAADVGVVSPLLDASRDKRTVLPASTCARPVFSLRQTRAGRSIATLQRDTREGETPPKRVSR